jgi:hypothetical protein
MKCNFKIVKKGIEKPFCILKIMVVDNGFCDDDECIFSKL